MTATRELYAPLYEDQQNGVAVVEHRYLFANIAANATTVVRTGPGVLHRLIINAPVASQVITLYDNTSAAGTKIGTITLPATLLSSGPVSVEYNIAFTTGLTVVTATGASADITVVYR